MRRSSIVRARQATLAVIAVISLGACSGLSQRVRATRSPVHAAAMLDLHDARVLTAPSGAPVGPTVNSTLASLDVVLQRADGGGLGLAGRVIGGGASAPSAVELGMLVGSKLVAGELGFGVRTSSDPTESDEDYDLNYPVVRVGLRSRANLGSSPFSVHLRAARYLGLPADADEQLSQVRAEGWNAESGLSWTWTQYPVSANFGYRIERFRVGGQEQEVSSLFVGAGMLLGRR